MKIKTIGIVGGGQLGRMICFEILKQGHKAIIFCNNQDSPAVYACNEAVIADFNDENALTNFAKKCDIITFEFENIPLHAIEFLEKITKVFPSSQILKITQNRLLEKEFLQKNHIKTANFAEVSTNQNLLQYFETFKKAILKTATMGYDGKGQFVLKEKSDALNAWDEVLEHNLIKNKLILEQFCDFESEISVIVARSLGGEIACYEPLTNEHKDGILRKSTYPAQISNEVKQNAIKIAEKIAEKIDLIGVLAVEFFVMRDGELLVNEMAPRPHNSGHFSMDACQTSQFEQLVRAITNAKLGNINYHSKGFMINLIGEDVKNLEEYQQNSSAKIHLYGKKEVKEGRKMGHVNIIL
jgi:5-(carboxyamino)imidazole ribonucleotide synthase